MRRSPCLIRAASLLLTLAATPLGAQEAFVAPASHTVLGVAEATSAIAPTRRFMVTNRSSVPIVVYSVSLSSCVNVRQLCGDSLTDTRVAPGAKVQIGRVDAKERGKRYTYDWTFQYRADTSDARVADLLRRHGLLAALSGRAENLASQDSAAPVAIGTTADSAASRAPLTAADRQRQVVALDANNRPVATRERFRFRVAPNSILGSTRVPGATVPATGACINAVELAAYERDTTIAEAPAVAPRINPTSITLPTLPPALRDSSTGDARVVMRWVVDSTGASLPGSVMVEESPHGLLSVQMCSAIIAAYLVPGHDAAGRPVRTWVQVPITVRR